MILIDLHLPDAQKYFAIQARRQEISDAVTADLERLELRKQTAEEFKALSGAARESGVNEAFNNLTVMQEPVKA